MLMMLKAHIVKPADASNKEFYSVWLKEAEAALAAKEAGVIQAIWKVAGKPEVIAILDVESGDVLDRAIQSLPLWKLGYAHIVEDLEFIALRPYENWAEDLQTLAQG